MAVPSLGESAPIPQPVSVNFFAATPHPGAPARPEVSLSWQQVYCLVSPHEALLKALSASYPSMQSYYQGILQAAVAVGFTTPEVLLSLLWHAPRGNARQHPEIWGHLQKLVAEAQPQPGRGTFPGKYPLGIVPG